MVEWATLPSWSRTRLVDAGVAMAVDVAPERGDAVDVAAPVGVDQVRSLGALDHQRLLLAPAPLLGERVPEVVVIELRGISRHRQNDPSPASGGNRHIKRPLDGATWIGDSLSPPDHRREPQVVDARRDVLRAVHDHARQHGRERRAAFDPARPRGFALGAGVDRQRLHALLRGAAGDRRPSRGHLRAPPHVPLRRRRLRAVLGDGRPRRRHDLARGQPRRAGRRRRADDAGDPLDRHRRLPAQRARQGDGDVGGRLRAGARGRPGAGRLPHRARQLAGDLLPQHPGRGRRRRGGAVRGARVARHHGRPRGRLPRRGGADRRR